MSAERRFTRVPRNQKHFRPQAKVRAAVRSLASNVLARSRVRGPRSRVERPLERRHHMGEQRAAVYAAGSRVAMDSGDSGCRLPAKKTTLSRLARD